MRRVREVILRADRRLSEYVKYRTVMFAYEGDFASFVQYNKPQVNLMLNRGARIPGKFPHVEGTGPTALHALQGSRRGGGESRRAGEGRSRLVRHDGYRSEEALTNDERTPHADLLVPGDRAEEFVSPRRGIEAEPLVALDGRTDVDAQVRHGEGVPEEIVIREVHGYGAMVGRK